ncbi:tRNA epoxyqueuosine(34) reductase QueG [bacterium]|nr:tRNA epoxyqueuosine(34) reductase QueG [bacterium]
MHRSRPPKELSDLVKAKALSLGFEACGISTADSLAQEQSRLEEWLARGYQASMSWMNNHREKRVDPRELVEGAKSVVSVIQSYYHPLDQQEDPSIGKISRYALGEDYHLVMKEKLFELLNWMMAEVPGCTGRAFVDSAPVMDKAWAAKAGLGWIGKHSNLISPEHGSWFFIGELIVDLDLAADGPILDHCGTCTRCIDACPTDAIVQPYVVDANLCISYNTIEHRGNDVPTEVHEGHGNWIFGCDVCQEVCPWNKFRTESSEPRYAPQAARINVPLEEWAELTQEEFSATFRKSAVKRTKWDGFIRNVQYAQKNEQKRHQAEE